MSHHANSTFIIEINFYPLTNCRPLTLMWWILWQDGLNLQSQVSSPLLDLFLRWVGRIVINIGFSIILIILFLGWPEEEEPESEGF